MDLPNFFQSSKDYLKSCPEREKLVFTNGCFDVLHVGHVRYLKAARDLGNCLIIGLNSDESVRQLKGKDRPLNNQNHRAEILLSLNLVDVVILFEEDTPLTLIESIRPAILTKGGDYQKSDVVGANLVESYGGKVVILPYIEGFSSSKFIKKIKSL